MKSKVFLVFVLFACLLCFTGILGAQTFTVTNETQFQTALTTADNNSADDIINVTADMVVPK